MREAIMDSIVMTGASTGYRAGTGAGNCRKLGPVRGLATEGCFRSNVANDEAYRSAGEPRIGHQPHDNAPLSAERGDARGRIEHLRHSRRAARTLVAQQDHVIVFDLLGRL